MRREGYVRPPVVAAEAPSAAAARWRYRVTAVLLLVLALAFFTWLLLHVSGVTGGENPGLGGALGPQPGSGIRSSALVPRG